MKDFREGQISRLKDVSLYYQIVFRPFYEDKSSNFLPAAGIDAWLYKVEPVEKREICCGT